MRPIRRPPLRLVEKCPPRVPDAEPLTAREVEILRLMAKGLCNREIAEASQVTEGTVRTHIRNILGKLGANNRLQATLYALRDGLTTLEECLAPQTNGPGRSGPVIEEPGLLRRRFR